MHDMLLEEERGAQGQSRLAVVGRRADQPPLSVQPCATLPSVVLLAPVKMPGARCFTVSAG